MSMGAQPVLMEACDKCLFSKDAYADAVAGKLAAGHDFVSVRAEDMLTLAMRNPARVSEGVRTALETFRKPTLDIASGVQVSGEFLMEVIQRLQPTVAAAYPPFGRKPSLRFPISKVSYGLGLFDTR